MLHLSTIFSLGTFQDLLVFRVSRNLPEAHHFLLELQNSSVQEPVFSQPRVLGEMFLATASVVSSPSLVLLLDLSFFSETPGTPPFLFRM